MTQTEAMKQALEALEEAEAGHAAQILREALAESKPKYTTTRNAWTGKATHKCSVCGRDDFRSEHAAAFHKCQAIEQAEQAAIKRDLTPEQAQPVAWVVEDQHGERLEWAGDIYSVPGLPTFPLYTAPPQRQPEQAHPVATNKIYVTREQLAELYPPPRQPWVGLTDEEWETTHWSPDFRAGAKWAEAKLKEKNT